MGNAKATKRKAVERNATDVSSSERPKLPRRYAVGQRVRVWWPPTADENRDGFAGMYWPVQIVGIVGKSGYRVKYDNDEEENVSGEFLQPDNPPVPFGCEQFPISVGEFVEVFNGSESDPAAWLGQVVNRYTKEYKIKYPFHDEPDEKVPLSRVRRARIFEFETETWKMLKPNQTWEDGEIESPTELETIPVKEFAKMAAESQKQESRKATASSSASIKKRKGSSEVTQPKKALRSSASDVAVRK